MKKMMKIIGATLAATLLTVVVACTPQQKQAVARQLGIAAAVTWMGVDNPKPADVVAVKGVLTVIEDACCTNCGDGAISYYQTVYPLADQYISEKVDPAQQPMARLGAAYVLTSLDTAFAMNPKWSENANDGRLMIQAFCQGAQLGLAMAPTDPVMVAARRGLPVRATRGRK